MTNAASFYDRHLLLCDLAVATGISIAGIVAVEYCWTRSDFIASLHQNRQAIYSGVISTSGSMLGFVLATVSIIVGFVQTPKFKALRSSKHHATLYDVFFSTVYALALLTILGFVALFVDPDAHPRPFMTYAVWSLSVLSTVRVIRCVSVLKKVTSMAGQTSA